MAGGRYLGFPKYIADEITLSRNGEIRTAEAKYKGIIQLALEFRPGLTRQLTVLEKQLAENISFFKGDNHVLVPPGRGPRAQKVAPYDVTEAKWSPQDGMIKIRVNPSESWANLIPDEESFPATYNHFIGGTNIVAVRLT